MRISIDIDIDIDEALLREAMAASGQTSVDATVEEGLRLLIHMKAQVAAWKELKGVGWDGDLDAMRSDHAPDEP